MHTSQSGIFALGTPSHAYLEFDLLPGKNGRDLVNAILSFREPHTTMGGVNLVVGFRPELWREYAPGNIPSDLHGFNQSIVGIEDFTMPATQHDAVLWIAGSAYDVVFDISHQAIDELTEIASVADETSSWPYHGFKDLTGFIDGTENPSLIEAPEFVLVPQGKPGAAGSVLLLQKWPHERAKWEAVAIEEQERIIGRRKSDSEELDPKPDYAHAARTDQDEFGKIFRRNMPFGTVSNHGTMFVGFSASQKPLHDMLESMAGLKNGVRDALTRYTKPISGAYYFIPSAESLCPADGGKVLEPAKH